MKAAPTLIDILRALGLGKQVHSKEDHTQGCALSASLKEAEQEVDHKTRPLLTGGGADQP
jgi:hypothetical protein